MNEDNPLIGKIFIEGTLECLTGLHVGSTQGTLEVGGIDLPVVRDPLTREPYIPGSSFKGKLRSLLERKCNSETDANGKSKYPFTNIAPGAEKPIRIHVCGKADCIICRLFGSAGPKLEINIPSILLVRDLHIEDESLKRLENIRSPLQYTEWKSENVLDRVTAHAMPRDVERVPKGTKFKFEIVYNINNPAHLQKDLENLRIAFSLLKDDALGGHGSRGYGKVELSVTQIKARDTFYYQVKKAEKKKYEKVPVKEKITLAELEEQFEEIMKDINFLFSNPGRKKSIGALVKKTTKRK